MERRVFVSFLGNTQYHKTTYKRLDGTIQESPFVQEVLFDSLCSEWTENDKIYIICTEGLRGSYNINWMNPSNLTLKEVLQSKHYSNICTPILLKEGIEQDIWSLFGEIDKLILKGDHLFLDVTNAFRSFPTFATTLLRYEKHIKGIEIEGLYYGLFRNSSEESLIQDLTSIVQLQDCVDMAGDLKKFGRFNNLAHSISSVPELEKLAFTLEELDKALVCNIGKYIRSAEFKGIIEQHRKEIRKSNLPKPSKEIILNIINNLSGFNQQHEVDNLLAASRWAYKYRMLPQAYAFGKEYINRAAEIRLRRLNPYHGRDARKYYLSFINVIMGLPEETVSNCDFKDELAKFRYLTEKLLSISWIKEIRQYYVPFNNYRNSIAHIRSDFSYEDFVKCYESNFENCVKIVQAASTEEQEIICNTTPLFINLSNHPFIMWSEKQKMAAREYGEYGEIIDIQFPKVIDSLDETYIKDLVNQYCNKILLLVQGNTQKVVVHVMGEMTFTYLLVKELSKIGMICIASTTERIVEELPDGSKNVKFDFCRFRRYE